MYNRLKERWKFYGVNMDLSGESISTILMALVVAPAIFINLLVGFLLLMEAVLSTF